MEIDITLVIKAVVMLICAIVSAFVVPWLKQKIGAERMTDFLGWVDVAVAAAEQLFSAESTQAKKQYVLNFLNLKGISYNELEVDAAIEAAVIKLHNQLYGAQTTEMEKGGDAE